MSTLLEKYKQKVARDNALFEEKCKGIAFSLARKIVKEQLAEKYNLDVSECDSLLEDKVALVKKYAVKILPKVRQQKMNRQQSFTQGTKLQNLGSEEHDDGINEVFKEYYEESERGYDQQRVAGPTDKVIVQIQKPNPRAMPPVEFNPPEQRLDDPKLERSLQKKSARSNLPVETLREVFERGVAAWSESTGVTQEQYGFARVNSFINGGKSFTQLDTDLSEAIGAALATGAAVVGGAYAFGKAKQKVGEFLDPKEPSFDEKPPEGYEIWKKDREKAAYQGTTPKPHPKDKEYTSYRQREQAHEKNVSAFKSKQAKRAKTRDTLSTIYKIASAKTNSQSSIGQPMDGQVGGPPSGVRESVNEHNCSNLQEARAPGKAYVKHWYGDSNNSDKPTALVSSDKWGHKKWWQPWAAKSAHKHAGLPYEEGKTEINEARPENNPYYDETEKAWNSRKADWEKSQQKKKFSNWTHEFQTGDKTKVLHGPGTGLRGTIVGKHDNGAVYSVKHGDGTVKKYHISTLEIPYGVSEEVANAEKITTDPNLPTSRFVGSDAVVKTFKDATPGQSENIEEGAYRGDRKGVPISATWVVGPDGKKRYRRGYVKRQPTSDTATAPLSGPVSV